jgi:hypothetical protein
MISFFNITHLFPVISYDLISMSITSAPWLGFRNDFIAVHTFKHSISFTFYSLPFLLLGFLPNLNFSPLVAQIRKMSASACGPFNETGQGNDHRDQDNTSFHGKISRGACCDR